MRKTAFFILIPIFLFASHIAEAGGIVMQRQQMKQQAQQRALAQQRAVAQQIMQQRALQQQQIVSQLARRANLTNDIPENVEDLQNILSDFESLSIKWTQIMDRDVKLQIVLEYMDWYREQNIIIRKSPYLYIDMIDDVAVDNPNLLYSPFNEVLRYIAIMEYDFENGVDPDLMARNLLGDQLYQENRIRLGLQ